MDILIIIWLIGGLLGTIIFFAIGKWILGIGDLIKLQDAQITELKKQTELLLRLNDKNNS